MKTSTTADKLKREIQTAPARIVTLDRNYRSTDAILGAANAVIGEAPGRFTKNLWTERRSAEKPLLVTARDEAEQANYVADKVLEAHDLPKTRRIGSRPSG